VVRPWPIGLYALVIVCAAACVGDHSEPEIATHVDDWRDEVIYQIVVDRFANGDPSNDSIGGVGTVAGDLARYQGGDWSGITEQLDYLDALGVTTLWISPINANVERTDYQDGYHGYWASDFTTLNPHFGDLAELRKLVDSVHARGMKIIVDIVANHTGRVFYYDLDADRSPDDGELEPAFLGTRAPPGQIEWLVAPPRLFVRDDDDAQPVATPLAATHFHRHGQTTDGSQMQKQLGDFPTGLRDLDTENDYVVGGLIDTFTHWVELTDVDGFRLDAIPHAPHEFWREFAQGVRRRLESLGKRRFLLLGEVFDGDPARLASYTSDGGLDSVFDFTFKLSAVDGFVFDGKPAVHAAAALSSAAEHYPSSGHRGGVGLSPWQARVTFASNHDVPRLRYWLDDPWAAELAMTMVFTAGGIPSVYYGTEQEFRGGWGNAAREPLWQSGFRRDTRMFRHLAKLAAIRRQSRALRRGDLTVRYASEITARTSGAGAGLLVWERHIDGDRALIAINGHPTDNATARVCTGFATGDVLANFLADGDRVVVDADGCVDIELKPRRASILLLTR